MANESPITPYADILTHFLQDLLPALLALLIPGIFLYLSLYAFAKRWKTAFVLLSIPTLLGFWMSSYVAPVRCAAFRALLNFAVAAATMKLLDIHALTHTSSFPTYTAGPKPRPSLMALILLTELRYESFTPNPIRHPPPPARPFSASPSLHQYFYSEATQLVLHIGSFIFLQMLPQYDSIKALGILHTIWIIWTSIQLLVRYRTSPPLFGPLYLADSLATFWTETWHNAFASPCLSLAYVPTLFLLSHSPIQIPRAAARGAAVVASFVLMAAFHVYALAPLLSLEGRKRIGVFFVGNGVLTVLESVVWGRRRHWLRAGMAWGVELALASWTVGAAEVADGVLAVDWRALCVGSGV
ncbi:hypothetical protein K505DRAFT_321387 [Melanomma pulvis-pyrius CBS 109.77]|uniref:Wax synthase domain-containing protein n=1 Tax=Melanomma pulvis-pyrius CBS 109.77 TaxID=1314802 RepID=A0A6A6XSY2_9PLEO|nr:hypothetical protein K505DRAFT_321387 [Melanomma pulvis-pyrius CBS 109.77]